jgi:hypothetical protein
MAFTEQGIAMLSSGSSLDPESMAAKRPYS